MRILIILMIAQLTQTAYAFNPAKSLNSAFCLNVGVHTQRALAQSQQLQEILKLLEADANCQSISASTNSLLNNLTSLESLNAANDNIAVLENDIDFYQEQLELEMADSTQVFIENYRLNNPSATDAEVEVAISNFTPTSNLIIDLELKVKDLKLELFQTRLSENQFTENNGLVKKTETVKAIGSNITSLFGAISSSNACTNANESIAPQIISNILGAAGSALPGVYGAIASVGAELIGGAAEVIRNVKYKKNFRKLEFNDFKQAVSCSFEGISRSYCQARDTQKLVNFHIERRNQVCLSEDCKLLTKGLDLLTKKSNSLNAWTNLILSGATPRDENQVGPYERAVSLRATFEVIKQTLKGMVNGARDRLSAPSQTVGDQNVIKRELMIKLASTITSFTSSSNSSSSPKVFARFFINDTSCGPWAYLFNPTDSNDRTLEQRTEFQSCLVAANLTYAGIVQIPELIKRIDVLNLETSNFVSSEFQRVSEENTSNILMKFNSRDNLFKTKPKEFVEGTLRYYSNLKSLILEQNEPRPLLITLIERAESQLVNTLEEVSKTECDTITIPDRGDEDPGANILATDCDLESEKLTNLSVILAPNQQNLSIQDSLRSIFREHVEILKDQGEISDPALLAIINSTSEDSSSILARTALDLQLADEDSSLAMNMVKTNLSNFWSIFQKSIFKTLKRMKSKPMSRNDRKVYGRLCARVSLSPLTSSQKRKLVKYCSGTIYKSTNEGQIGSLEFDKMIQSSFEDRICKIYDFRRELMLLNRL